MTNATTSVIARVAAVVAGLGLVAASFAPIVSAQTTTTTTTTTSATFTRDLTLGSTGADVTALQNWLISKGHSIAAGATGYFGAQTRAALAAWQAANGVMPAAGYFGPITRAKISMGGSTTTTGGSTTTTTSNLSGGEASIEDFEVRDGDMDEVEEGSMAEIAEITFDVEDGDIRIDRLDIELDQTGGSTVSESDPWDAFDTITLYADGQEIASEDVSDEDDWLDDSAQIFRFTGLDYVVEEGDMGTIVVEIEAQNGVLNTGDTDTWTLEVNADGLRGVDGAGIQQYNATTDNLTFDLVEEGDGDDLSVRSSSEDPDAATLTVEDDGRSDWYTIFAFDLEADEDGGDIEINDLPVRFSTNDSDITTVINDAMLVIDGEEFDDITGAIGATTTFDIDSDYVVESGDRVTVEVMVEFKSLTGNYAEGTTISASTTGAFIDAEGSNDVVVSGSASGETHTLRTSGIDVALDEKSAVATVVDGADNDYATYKVVVDVTAFEDEFFISNNGGTAFTYQIEDASTGTVISTSTATTSVVSSTADLDGSSYRVGEDDTESFTFTVTLNPLAADEGKSYRVQLLSIVYGTTSGSPTGLSWAALPASDYETQGVLIND